jgi:hypothetical protein
MNFKSFEKMQLPPEIVEEIIGYLNDVDQTILSFTCQQYRMYRRIKKHSIVGECIHHDYLKLIDWAICQDCPVPTQSNLMLGNGGVLMPSCNPYGTIIAAGSFTTVYGTAFQNASVLLLWEGTILPICPIQLHMVRVQKLISTILWPTEAVFLDHRS